MPTGASAQARAAIEGYLGGEIGFTRRDLASIGRGRVVTRLVDTDDPREIAVASVGRVPASLERFMAEAGDASRLLSGRTVAHASVVPDPARASDFATLTLPEGDIEDLERCRPGDCKVKLPEEAMRAVASLDWSGPVPRREAEAHVRTMLAGFAGTVRAGGKLPDYADKRRPVAMREGFRSIVDRHPYFLAHLPQMRHYVTHYPSGPEFDAQSTLVWMEERFGLKPVISLNHVAVHLPNRVGAVDALLTIEQLYATHYFEASASMVAFLESEEEPGSWFIHIRHHRFDGTLNPGQRRTVQRQIRAYVEDFVTERVARLARHTPP